MLFIQNVLCHFVPHGSSPALFLFLLWSHGNRDGEAAELNTTFEFVAVA